MTRLGILAAGLLLTPTVAEAATILLQNNDGAGEGFNDPTPVAPVGGNPGTTIGEQRLNVVLRAAEIWGGILVSSQTITVAATFDPLTPCSHTSGLVGSSEPTGFATMGASPPPGTFTNTFYPIALAESLRNTNLNGSTPEITARFNSSVGQSGCLPSAPYWYGTTTPAPPGTTALLPIVLHELAHGLGFLSFVCDEPAGCGTVGGRTIAYGDFPTAPSSIPDIWAQLQRDLSSNKLWVDMTIAERAASITNDPDLAWDGATVTATIPVFQPGGPALNSGRMRLHAPSPVDPGSSVSHFTSAADPQLLMEPVLSSSLFDDVDMTEPLFADIGWQLAIVDPNPIFANGFED